MSKRIVLGLSVALIAIAAFALVILFWQTQNVASGTIDYWLDNTFE